MKASAMQEPELACLVQWADMHGDTLVAVLMIA